MALSLGEQSARLGLHEDAARLFDLSGDDLRLADYLDGRARGTAESGPSNRVQPEQEELIPIPTEPAAGDGDGPARFASAGVEAAAAERLRALASAREAGGGGGVGGAALAGVCGKGCATNSGLFRRSSLLAGVSRFPQVCG